MPATIRSSSAPMSVRILRLAGAVSIMAGLLAIAVAIGGGGSRDGSLLVAISILFGAGALLGLPFILLPFVNRRKDTHDS